ncbi:MAG: class I SAM-dependent methyltransferase [gamma proteobacterium symbiont of Lucinoma myriamae]|nr:class I SAM-dependent methyltransferase [gamma proteobacterium symbiont of Lucinoma myriamae]MCU7832692.1 class I SAM-dependent methyltransferase [gamma proteobacterium symbiont of Lucinoma myriamae]
MMDQTLQFYKKNNERLVQQYDSVNFKAVHQDWLAYLPSKDALIVDVGAGSGRDVFWLAEHGYKVVAVDPVIEFFEQFKKKSKGSFRDDQIKWVVDSLPDLSKLENYKNQVSMILLSAVWMHLTTQERINSFQTFSTLNNQHGLLVITLRYGASPDERLMYPVSIAEIKSLATQYHYQIKTIERSDDQLSRTEVFWETIVLEKI